jgi:hypothetical protein
MLSLNLNASSIIYYIGHYHNTIMFVKLQHRGLRILGYIGSGRKWHRWHSILFLEEVAYTVRDYVETTKLSTKGWRLKRQRRSSERSE